ncbi:MAG: glycosyltransferase [Betaproteobacteria bacterium]|nr:glycosyltransferase [Betaproteobacteria bacterium]
MDASANRRLRVLLFTNLFPTPNDPTRGIFTAQLARALADTCEVTVMCPLPWFPRFGFLARFKRWYEFATVPSRYVIDGIAVHAPKYIVLPRISEPLLGIFMFLGTYFTVRRLHRRQPFDVVNSMWLYPDSVAAGWIAKWLRIPMVPTALGCDVNKMLEEAGKRTQILGMLHQSRTVTAVSEPLRDGMVAKGVEAARIVTIPNGVDAQLFRIRDQHAVRSSLGLDAGKKLIVYVGRLSEEKGVSTLVRAAALLAKRSVDFEVHFVGDGTLRAELIALARDLGAADVVKFEGAKSHAEVAQWLSACNVFCLPSIREGCPNVVNEALASGRPVVASRVGGIPDMVSAGAGILVEASHPEALANALETAMNRTWDPTLVAATVQGATWQAAAARYVAAYQSAIA